MILWFYNKKEKRLDREPGSWGRWSLCTLRPMSLGAALALAVKLKRARAKAEL